MRNERTANELLQDYAVKEFEQRQAWAKVLVAPAQPRQAKPVAKHGFFAKLFKVV